MEIPIEISKVIEEMDNALCHALAGDKNKAQAWLDKGHTITLVIDDCGTSTKINEAKTEV